MKNISIRYRLGIVAVGFFLIIALMFIMTWTISEKQKDDGLVINLAGRQRMLVQKIVKETVSFNYARANAWAEEQNILGSLKATMSIFDKTHKALLESGEAPITLDPSSSEIRFCPKSDDSAVEKLAAAEKIKDELYAKIEALTADKANSDEAIKWMLENDKKILSELNDAVSIIQKKSEDRTKALLSVQIAGIVFGIAFTAMTFFTILSIIKRLEKIRYFAKALGNGDLSTKSEIAGSDELGIIGYHLDEMVKNLAGMFQTIKNGNSDLGKVASGLSEASISMDEKAVMVSNTSGKVLSLAERMQTNMHSVSMEVDETSNNISIVASAAEEMNATIQEVSGQTDKAAAVTGDAVIKTETAYKKMSILGEAADSIGKVTEVINEISDQTNLLALNATIEAARAGEAGKGFAVVAGEIKNLAGQTSEATKEIQDKVESIRKASNDTVVVIKEIGDIIASANEVVKQIAFSVEQQAIATREIAGNIGQISSRAHDITGRAHEGSMASEEISNEMQTLSKASFEILEKSSALKKNSAEMKNYTGKMSELVERFKI